MVTAMFFLSGCASFQADLVFHDDGSITSERTIAMADVFTQGSNSPFEDFENQALANGETVKETDDGVTASKSYLNIKELAQSGDRAWGKDMDGHLAYRQGFLYDSYELLFSFHGDESLKNQAGDLVSQTDADQLGAQAAKLTQAMLESIKIDFTISLPQAADSQNATKVSRDGLSYTWDLRPVLTRNQTVQGKIDFRIYHKTVLYVLAVLAVMLAIAALICLILALVERTNREKRRKLLLAAGVSMVVLLGGTGYVAYTLKNPPVLTDADRLQLAPARTSRQVPAQTDTGQNGEMAQTDTADASAQAVQEDSQAKRKRAGEQAQVALKGYYRQITAGNYRGAYNFLTPALQQQVGPYADFEAGYEATLSSDAYDLQVLSVSETEAVISYSLIAKDRETYGIKRQYFKGQATLVNLGGIWRISDMNVSKIREDHV